MLNVVSTQGPAYYTTRISSWHLCMDSYLFSLMLLHPMIPGLCWMRTQWTFLCVNRCFRLMFRQSLTTWKARRWGEHGHVPTRTRPSEEVFSSTGQLPIVLVNNHIVWVICFFEDRSHLISFANFNILLYVICMYYKFCDNQYLSWIVALLCADPLNTITHCVMLLLHSEQRWKCPTSIIASTKCSPTQRTPKGWVSRSK